MSLSLFAFIEHLMEDIEDIDVAVAGYQIVSLQLACPPRVSGALAGRVFVPLLSEVAEGVFLYHINENLLNN